MTRSAEQLQQAQGRGEAGSMPDRPDGDRGIAGAVASLMVEGMPCRLTAFDGSEAGDATSPVHVHLATPRGLSYVLTAPGDLGFARAYVAGDLVVVGGHPGDPYDAMKPLLSRLALRRPSPRELPELARVLGRHLGLRGLLPPAPPPQEALPPWRRVLEGARHTASRDARAIAHHYDLSNRFYELVLGPSMTYTCAVYPEPGATLEQAQAEKYDLVARKLGLREGMRLLDVGCGWGGMVRHAARHHGVRALGVTLSREQATWAQEAVKRDGLDHLVEVRHLDYREVEERDFDAISSIGLTEHIGVANYPAYFARLRSLLVDGGRLLNHSITRPHNRPTRTGAFIDRYVFPDGELTGVGRIITEAQDAGFEVRHEENLREHYALTLRDWGANLERRWDEAVEEVGLANARLWRLYMAGCRVGFETRIVELHQILAVKPDGADARMPLRPTWGS